MLSGVPVGVQVARLSCRRTGSPPALTRVAAVVHCAEMHFGVDPGELQPETVYVELWVTIFWPLTLTREFDTAGRAWPACEHRTVAPSWSR
jgi:hypothetical protein